MYSNNLFDIVSYLYGYYHGVPDLLNNSVDQYGLPADTVQLLNAIGPAITEAEKVALLSPVIKVTGRVRR